ncbi:MAG: hypothetical protein ACI3W5_12435 [Faecousia sp.]
MEYSPELLKQFAEMCGIPTVHAAQRIWIVRTKGGRYYQDFSLNGFIALGWDKIPLQWITSDSLNKQRVIDDIKIEYPDEKRPGLIYGQLVDFIRVMASGDYVVIPSEGSNFVNIGTIGDLFEYKPKDNVPFEADYPQCDYHLRRSVVWHKVASVNEDIYLSKMLRAQQTISDITKYADLIYRNLHDLYFVDGTLSLTLRKTISSATSLSDEIELLCAINETVKNVNSFFGEESPICIEKRTAMSSPGFLQLIIEGVKDFAPIIAFQQIFKTVGGKITSADGKEVVQGLPALLQAFSNLCNDKTERDLKRAQIRKMNAEAEKTEAETQKIIVETQAASIQNMDALIALGDKLTSGAEDAAILLERKKAECNEIVRAADERQKKLAPIMESMGLQPPLVELPNNIIMFPLRAKEPNDE